MTKPLRTLLVALILVALLIAGAAAWVLLVLDPNDYKSRIVEFAQRQGVTLDIRGDLDWRLLPRIGLRIESTSLRSARGEFPAIDLEAATLSMAWLPLLRGEPRIEALSVDGAEIRIVNRDQAAVAAAAPMAAAPHSEKAAAGEAGSVAIGVRAVDISDARVIVAGPAGDRVLEDLRFAGRDMVLDGSPFPIELEFRYRDPAMPMPVDVTLEAELGFDQQKLLAQARDAKLKLTPEQRPAIEASCAVRFDGGQGALDISGLEVHSAGLAAQGEVQVSDLGGKPRAKGRLEVPPDNPRPLLRAWQVPLPDFNNADALSRIGLVTGFQASPQDLRLADLELRIDDTRITGTATARLAAPRRLHVNLHGDRLDLERYRSAGENPESASPGLALLAPLAGPVAFLHGGTGELALDWDALTLDRLHLEAIRLRSRFAGDDVYIERFTSRTLGGSAALQGTLAGLRSDHPSLRFEPRADSIELAEVGKVLAAELPLDGTLNLSITGTARGADAKHLQQSLDAQGSFQIADPILTGTNIERTFCDLVATVDRTEKRSDWEDLTRFEAIAGNVRLMGSKVKLENLTTGIGNLHLRASGILDREAQNYEVHAIARLEGNRTSVNGCPVRSARLRDRDIPLRCSGTLGKQSRMLCAPDPQFVAGLAGDRALEELRERGKLEGERGKAVEGLLRGLLNQRGDDN